MSGQRAKRRSLWHCGKSGRTGVLAGGTDGGVFAFGGAPFEGSVPEVLPDVFPGDSLAGPIVGIAAVPN